MNPELREGATNAEWVTYAQELLAVALADEIEAGQVPAVTADGEFGQATAAAVRALQEREGLPATGVIDAATWEAMGAEIVDDAEDQTEDQTEDQAESAEGGSAEGGSAAAADDQADAAAEPVNLRVPFELQMRWEETDLERMLQDFENLELSNHPGAQLTFPEPVGRLFGNGGMRWLEYELRSNPTVYVEAATRAIIGWSSSQGLELGADNELEAGLRFQGVDLFLRGEFDARVHPMEGSGEISGGASINIRLNLDSIGR